MALHQSSSRDEPRRIVRAVDRIWTSVILALLSVQAQAQANDPITRLLNKGVDLLTNQWAVASAIITIAALGDRMKYGMMDKRFQVQRLAHRRPGGDGLAPPFRFPSPA